MRSYETARSLYSFLGFCAWCVIAVGAIVAFGGGAATASMARNAGVIQLLIAAAPGILITVVGAYGLAMVQNGRTAVDTAEYAQQALAVSREQLDISKQLLARSQAAPASYTSAHPTAPKSEDGQSEVLSTQQTVSYGNAPAVEKSEPMVSATPLAAPASNPPKTIATKPREPVLLEPVRHDIVYRDGKFAVADQEFRVKSEALEYQAKLLTQQPT